METIAPKPTSLILHGHFYQPPREDPLVDLIPKQPSAYPYSDWNERIYDDCYRANAFSRYLDPWGHIDSIVNNYEYLSFNFGPTLLTWIEKYHPFTYSKILEADKRSMLRLGHGNAIAQTYNHTILPLDTPEDALTQIIWGIEDFISRFNREPKGMWLSETAISPSVVSLLAQAGITYVILSPWQCKSIETEDGSWLDAQGDDQFYDRAFLLEGSDGSTISAFFYHGALASSISFGHMLRDADTMYTTLKSINKRDKPELLHTATDGEIYGHHEPFGDMALAALIHKVEEGSTFALTNYAAFLEKHPAVHKAILHNGEESKGTSWSCSHGVSRWYKDCGCHTGGQDGWNQKWRTPLRDAFTQLGGVIDTLFEQQIHKLFKKRVDPLELLRSYVSVLSHKESISTFISRWEQKSGVTVTQKHVLAQLLEGQKFKFFSFTSCGWFFSDVSGIEPKQNIHYAVRAMQLYQQFSQTPIKDPILEILFKAKSNLRQGGNGKSIALPFFEGNGGELEATVYFIMNRQFAKKEDFTSEYGKFSLLACHSPHYRDYQCEIMCNNTLTPYCVSTIISTDPSLGYIATLTSQNQLTQEKHTKTLSSTHIPPRMLDQVFRWIERSLSQIADEEINRLAQTIRHYSYLAKRGSSAPPETLYVENMGTCLRALRSLFTSPVTLTWEEKKTSISYLLDFVQQRGGRKEKAIVSSIFNDEIEDISQSINDKGFSYERGSYLLEVLEVARTYKVDISITLAQEAMYPTISQFRADSHITPLTKDVLTKLQSVLNFAVKS